MWRLTWRLKLLTGIGESCGDQTSQNQRVEGRISIFLTLFLSFSSSLNSAIMITYEEGARQQWGREESETSPHTMQYAVSPKCNLSQDAASRRQKFVPECCKQKDIFSVASHGTAMSHSKSHILIKGPHVCDILLVSSKARKGTADVSWQVKIQVKEKPE